VSRSCELQSQEEELNLEKEKKNLRDTSRGTGVKLDKAKKTNLVVSKSNGHGTSHQPSPPYYDLLKKSVKMILLKN